MRDTNRRISDAQFAGLKMLVEQGGIFMWIITIRRVVFVGSCACCVIWVSGRSGINQLGSERLRPISIVEAAYDWTPLRVAAFGARFRQLVPNGYLALEHSIGHLPVGGGPADYAREGPLSTYDAILSEFDGELIQGDSTWQVAGRLLGPLWRRPPDMPAGDDPRPPWYLAPGTSRGPYHAVAFEYDTYRWVRNRVTVAQVGQHRQYLKSLGYAVVN